MTETTIDVDTMTDGEVQEVATDQIKRASYDKGATPSRADFDKGRFEMLMTTTQLESRLNMKWNDIVALAGLKPNSGRPRVDRTAKAFKKADSRRCSKCDAAHIVSIDASIGFLRGKGFDDAATELLSLKNEMLIAIAEHHLGIDSL